MAGLIYAVSLFLQRGSATVGYRRDDDPGGGRGEPGQRGPLWLAQETLFATAAAGVIFFAAFAQRQRTAAAPLVKPSLLRNRASPSGSSSAWSSLPMNLLTRLGARLSLAGLVVTVGGVAVMATIVAHSGTAADPLAHLEVSIDAQRAAHPGLHALAHDLAGGCWLLTGGSGYDLVRVVPRTWTHLNEAYGRLRRRIGPREAGIRGGSRAIQISGGPTCGGTGGGILHVTGQSGREPGGE